MKRQNIIYVIMGIMVLIWGIIGINKIQKKIKEMEGIAWIK